MRNHKARRKEKSQKADSSKGILLKLEWPKEEIFDDGKQSDFLTGAAHPGCCKQ